MSHNTISPIRVSTLLKKYGLRPSKGLGQNFLVDQNALYKVVKAADITDSDIILEVGPGLGSLTRHLASKAQKVFAVELDERLLPALHETLAEFGNVEIIIGDILKMDPIEILKGVLPGINNKGLESNGNRTSTSLAPTYKVVANIPYYITSALIRHLLEASIKPDSVVLTVQKEVAERICADPPQMSVLALSVQVYGTPSTVAKIPAGAFYPAPKVDSSVVKIELFSEPLIPQNQLSVFFRLVKAGFSQKRKTLRNTLAAGMHWPKDKVSSLLLKAGIDPQRRAQTLSIEEWRAIINLYLNESN